MERSYKAQLVLLCIFSMRAREKYHRIKLSEKEDSLLESIWTNIKDLGPLSRHHLLYALLARKPFRPMAEGFANFKDQLLHVIYPMVILGIFSYGLVCNSGFAYLYAALSGLLLGIIRETEQYFGKDLRILMLPDRLLDISMFTLGAVILMFLIQFFWL